MKLRLIKKDSQKLLLCQDGTVAIADNELLRKLFVCFDNPATFSGKYGHWNKEIERMDDFEGKTLAYVSDDCQLCLIENPFMALMQNIADDEYITLHEYAELHRKNDNRIKALCREERILGAIKKAGKWFIPKHAPYPQDARYSGVEK